MFPSKAAAINSPSKAHIVEANKHLQLLHAEVTGLHETLAQRESLWAQREGELIDVINGQRQELGSLTQSLFEANMRVDGLSRALKEKESAVGRLRRKSDILNYMVKHRAVLEDVVTLLSTAQRLDVLESPSPGPVHAQSWTAEVGAGAGVGARAAAQKTTEAHGVSELALYGADSPTVHSGGNLVGHLLGGSPEGDKAPRGSYNGVGSDTEEEDAAGRQGATPTRSGKELYF